MRRLSSTRARRWAFTLIEMLVVVALILILLTITAAMFPRFAESQRITKGADQLSGRLLNAKQRALRDRKPTGVRITANNELVFIQQPDDFSTVGRCTGTQPGLGVVFEPGVDLTGGHSTEPQHLWAVQRGDYLEVNGGGLVRQITDVATSGNVTRLLVVDWNTRPVPPGPYRIIRMPRLVAGERPVQLPQNIVIDLGEPGRIRSLNVPQRTITGIPPIYEILFEPGGRVVGQGTSTGDNILLWVRDTTRNDSALPIEGSPLLVSIHTRTGMIAVHPVNTGDPTNYYLFTKDGRSSGL